MFGRTRECTASTIIRTIRQSIMTLVMRSTPFCRPRAHTPNEIRTAITMKSAICAGDWSICEKLSPICSALCPESPPVSERRA